MDSLAPVENPPSLSTPPVETLFLVLQGFALCFHIFFAYRLLLLKKSSPPLLRERENEIGGTSMKFSCEKALLSSAVSITSRAVAAA